MASVSPLTERTQFFQQLKRECVPLSRLALAPRDNPVDAKETLRLLDALANLWTVQATKDASILDEKLADYVFFPLSHLLQSRDRYPVRVTEVIICLLRVLVQYGWKSKTSPELFQQLLVFLSIIIGGFPGQSKQSIPEETLVESFRTLAALINIATPSHLTPPGEPAVENKTTQALGRNVTLMMEGVTEGVIPEIQLEAAQCLRLVFTNIKDNAVLAQFLPGTVSALTKVLAPPQANHTQKRVLISCLEVLNLVLTHVLGDIKVRGILKKLESSEETADETTAESTDSSPGALSPSWIKATVSQVKIALAAVLKLRAHESEEVQSALHRLCVSLLDECHSSLANCQLILVETAMMLEEEGPARSLLETNLRDLAGVYPELGDSIKAALYNWITGLPRVMQSSDEGVKQLAIRSVLRGSKLADAMQMGSSTLEDALGDSLRDSIVTLVKGSKPSKIVDDTGTDILASTNQELATYNPVLLDSEGQKTTRKEVGTLISSIGSATQQVNLATAMLGHVRDSEGVDQISSFWLAFELLKATYAQSSDMDDLFDLSSLGESKAQEEAFRELYDFSASVLSAHSDSVEADWRLEAIALEVTAFAASRIKVDFRPELIDVLYPITTFLGSSLPQLRNHAITTLNLLAASCGYGSVSDLIVDNADYMVNSISLRLNTFDISPASTKVLTMVIRLTGPRLIPYLDDVVAAIFAALDNYHGYPVFVESLFSVLTEVVTQGVKSDMLLLEGTASNPPNHRKHAPQPLTIPTILETLTKRLSRATAREDDAEPRVPHPKTPWKRPPQPGTEAASLLDQLTNPDTTPDDDDNPDSQPPENENPPAPKSPTYTLLTSILSLTQHHLTSPTPTLRKSLLDLIATVAPALAPDENAFLPLVHAVWPVVVARLRDGEGFVAVAACRALAGVCEAAGDFVAGRLAGAWWGADAAASGGGVKGGLGRWVRSVKEEALLLRGRGHRGEGKGKGILVPGRQGGVVSESSESSSVVVASGGGGGSSAALGRFTQAAQVWEAVLALLTAIVSFVRVEDDMFDDILAVVADVLPRHAALKEALEAVNADAVWLALYERGMAPGGLPPLPAGEGLAGFGFARADGVAV